MNEDEIPVEYRRTALASEAKRQLKYQRWAAEMIDHGWLVHQPSLLMTRALALQNAVKRLEKARAEAEKENAR
jgi:hypothetical protein